MSDTLSGVYRVGRTAELRSIPSGEAVINLSLATNYGRKSGPDGVRPTKWVDAAVWGKMAESLAPFLVKGQQVYVVMEDSHDELYTDRQGQPRSKTVGRVQSIELVGARRQDDAGDGQQQQPAPQAPQQAPRVQAPQRTAPRPASGFDDMSDDIPF